MKNTASIHSISRSTSRSTSNRTIRRSLCNGSVIGLAVVFLILRSQTVQAQEIDFGDVPGSYGTLLIDNGARHMVPGYDDANNTAPLMLGSNIDTETDGQPSTDANLDNFDDGVHFNTDVSVPGRLETVFVTASDAGFLNGWIDFNLNGAFDASEQISTTSRSLPG